MEELQWTPKEANEGMTIPQYVAIWMREESEGWHRIDRGDALAWARRKEAEKQAKEKAGG